MALTVGVLGAKGRMGTAMAAGIAAAQDLALGGLVDAGDPLDDLTGADAVLVFTAAGQAMDGLRWCASHGVHAVIGTTGFADADVAELRTLFDGVDGRPNAALIPNFAVGAVLLFRLSELCAPHFDTVEVLEAHHNSKIDAPSGTAVATARRIAAAREASGAGPFAADPTTEIVADGARGGDVDGVRVHSMRMRGMIASQEVVFGAEGQWLTLRHDTSSRDSFLPGVLLALRRIAGTPGFTVGLDTFLGL
jgi:4-hydroxy-tetrahydrodipicolinate reductase